MIEIIQCGVDHHDHPLRHHSLSLSRRDKGNLMAANRAKASEPRFTSTALGFDRQMAKIEPHNTLFVPRVYKRRAPLVTFYLSSSISIPPR